MGGFNWLDFILIVMLLIAMAIGYTQGVIRQLIGLLAIYIGLVLATQFFVPLTKLFSSLTQNPPTTLSNMIAFFVILVAVMVIINIIARDAYKSIKIKIFPLLDHIGGMGLGVLSMWILVTVVVNVMTFAINTQSWGRADIYRLILEGGLGGSLVAGVTSSTLPMIVSSIRPWMQGGFPAIFEL